MAGQSSPSSSYEFDYDVFLSFRGSDTRSGFTGHLYDALHRKGIRTFIDDRELQRGEEITSALSKYIEDSKIAIIVFSKNYASSSFCLDELVHIIECSMEKDRLVLPVFYDVEPTHVRHQTGSYGEAIAEHEQRFQNNKGKYTLPYCILLILLPVFLLYSYGSVITLLLLLLLFLFPNKKEKRTDNMKRLKKWKMALNQAANLKGDHFILGKEYEYRFIGKIVDWVSNKINRIPLHVADYRVGLESRVQQVKSLLDVGSDDRVYMVGIHGIGGIGKTTLAKEIYNAIASQFEVLCFLDDVRKKTLVQLQETLLCETIGEKDMKLGSVSKGISIIKQRLHKKKVLLIFDDVDDLKQLQAMVGEPHWLGDGSRVIITTRDKHLLASYGIERTYEVEELNKDEALKLLRRKAFKNNKVDSNYEDILNRVVTYASGLPLALEVVGSNLCGSIKEWESTLAEYIRIPPKDIQDILKVSFEALEEDVKSVFLDIACCFNGYALKKAESILCAHHGHCIKHHIRVLVEKSLIKLVGSGSLVRLHDLIEDMGKEIVRRESSKDPGERSRLWFHEDIAQVLKENTGTSKIEIIHLDFRSTKEVIDWDGNAFKKMRNLKTLIIKSITLELERDIVSQFSEGPKHFPSSLRVLEWEEYPSQCVPSIFSNKKFENMKVLKFDGCKYLIEVSDVSGVPNLEEFSFTYCYNLTTIHKSIGLLNKLKILDVAGCINLRSFPPIKLTSLQKLTLDNSGLESFPEILGEMKNITKLKLQRTSIKELPFSFHNNLTGLCELEIYEVRLPIHILMMSKLSRIYARRCLFLPIQNDNLSSIASSNVKDLRLVECNLSDEILSIVLKLVANVEELYLYTNNFTILPECIKECRFLSGLSLIECDCLQEIRGIPPNLKYLNAADCKSLTSTSRSMLLNKELHEDGGTFFFLPGTERIPEWFEHQSREPSISFWFRNNIPSVALFFVCKFEEACLFINGDEYDLFGEYHYVEWRMDHTYLFDLKLQDRGLESKLDEALLKNEWIHAEVRDDSCEYMHGEVEFEIGIHVFKEKTNMEDIQFSNPYKQRKLDLNYPP